MLPVRRLMTPLAGQVAAMILALALLALWPPASGAMLMVPLRGGGAGALGDVVAAGGALLARGPLPGSFVVFGDRARIEAGVSGRAVLLLAAPAWLCGEGR